VLLPAAPYSSPWLPRESYAVLDEFNVLAFEDIEHTLKRPGVGRGDFPACRFEPDHCGKVNPSQFGKFTLTKLKQGAGSDNLHTRRHDSHFPKIRNDIAT
jgi:hypothetical protein